MRGLSRRVERLETRLGFHDLLSQLTLDELQLALLDTARNIAADATKTDEERAEARTIIDEVEESIRRQARAQKASSYSEHLAWIVKVTRGRHGDYVPCICCPEGSDPGSMEYCDLERPCIMERRAVLRARPDVQILTAEIGTIGHA